MVKVINNNKPVLPTGWLIIKSIRNGGMRRGRVDKIYLSPDLRAFRSYVSAQRFINANAIINVPNATPVAPVPVVSVANIVLVQDTPVVPVVILVSDSDSGGEEDAMNEIISFLSSDDEIGILLSSDEDDEIGILLSSDDEIEL